jgi:hypothetical protein
MFQPIEDLLPGPSVPGSPPMGGKALFKNLLLPFM